MFTKAEEGQKRVDDRLDVLWDAIAIIDGKEYPCEVANVSTGGALMKLDIDLDYKHHFILDVQELSDYAAEVVWVNRPFYGLRLLVGDNIKLKEHADKIGLRTHKTP
ncbi:MAG: PilZ domain-containing protein [Emcibacter sp.]|nr:PilZ domain-containing protein [Emcibacter sp.]